MAISISDVLKALQLAGTSAPAFVELFNVVKRTFGERDQERLKDAYAEAQRRSDAAHEELQQAARDAGA